MRLEPGARLGPYEISNHLGSGGMGEVYRARDTRLGRSVALKWIRPEAAGDAERRARFETEASTIARLTHPHICTLYDVAEHEGRHVLVMEYLAGETVAARIARGAPGTPAMPVSEALAIAIQVADALGFAHRHHVVHRDVKPANIMLTSTGAKLLDFGLAKLRGNGEAAQAVALTRTVVTSERAVLGTLAYMAPEQVNGHAETRSDLFALGAVLYEMLTGRRAFAGDSVTSVIAAIASQEPPALSTLRTDVSPALERAVKKCLAKEPDRRWQTAADLADELRWLSGDANTPPVIAAGRSKATGRRLTTTGTLVACGAAALVGAAATWALTRTDSSAPRAAVAHVTIPLPSEAPLSNLGRRPFAVSPDGSRLVYVAGVGSGSQLYLRPLDRPDVQPLGGTAGASAPFFSPDGEWVGFFAEGRLKKVPVAGGPSVTVAEGVADSAGSSGTWGENGDIVFAQPDSAGAGLRRVIAGSGTPVILTKPAAAEGGGHVDPFLFDGGRQVLFSSTRPRAGVVQKIFVTSLADGEPRPVLENGSDAKSVPTGHLVFCRGQRLLAVPWTNHGAITTASPTPVIEGVADCNFDVSATGLLVFRPTAQIETRRLVWVDRTGAVQTIGEPRAFERPRLSPDGRRIAMEIRDRERSDLYMYNLDNGALIRLTTAGGNSPMWTPDGRRIVFRRAGNLYWKDASGGEEELLVDSTDPALQRGSALAPGAWTPDGSTFAFVMHMGTANAADVWALQLRPTRRIRRVVSAPGNQWGVRVSPDGQWLSYASDRSGRFEVLVERFPEGGEPFQVSTGGGREAVWSPDGRELYYRTNDDRMMAAAIRPGPAFSTERPRQLFVGRFTSMDIPNYGVNANGTRFLMVKPSEEELGPTALHAVVNWFEELKRLVPAR